MSTMRTLYEIDTELLACEYVDEETGEIIDEEKLKALEMEREAKIEGVILWRKNVLAELEMVKNEYRKFKQRMDSLSKKEESLKNYICYALGGEKFKTSKCNVYYVTKPSVIIDDLAKVDRRFWKAPKEDWISKTEIAEAIKDGEEVEGAHQEEKTSIIIK